MRCCCCTYALQEEPSEGPSASTADPRLKALRRHARYAVATVAVVHSAVFMTGNYMELSRFGVWGSDHERLHRVILPLMIEDLLAVTILFIGPIAGYVGVKKAGDECYLLTFSLFSGMIVAGSVALVLQQSGGPPLFIQVPSRGLTLWCSLLALLALPANLYAVIVACSLRAKMLQQPVYLGVIAGSGEVEMRLPSEIAASLLQQQHTQAPQDVAGPVPASTSMRAAEVVDY